ncbi:MAG TPA: Eco57I restriction-modification methylase domain-containing protein, partial [Nitrososphaeraceae archaeon]
MNVVQSSIRTNHGTVMTNKLVADFMLDISDYLESKNLSNVKLLDPSAGNGIFILSSIERLYRSSVKFGFSFSESLDNLMSIELDSQISNTLLRNIKHKLSELGLSPSLAHKLTIKQDYLTSYLKEFDIVIGNPPYVRHERIAHNKKKTYRSLFKTFSHRSDLYIAFLEKSLQLLRPSGILCFICPDRWLRNKYGEIFRRHLFENYSLSLIINLHNAEPFEEKVNGYPIVVKIKSTEQRGNIDYFVVDNIEDLKRIANIKDSNIQSSRSTINHRIIHKPKSYDQLTLEESYKIPNPSNLTKIEEQGFRIGIGVATGLDDVFLSPGIVNRVERNLLVPIVLSKDVINGEIVWSKNYVLNPYEKDGSLINLNDYPMAKSYFISNFKRLS